MSTRNEFDSNASFPMDDEHDISDMATLGDMGGRIAEALIPLAVPAARAAQLQQRLAARAAQSVAQHRGLHIIRSGDVVWQTIGKGVRACVMHDTGESRSALVEWAPGASLPGHRHAAHEECIVLRGGLQADDCHVGVHDYHLAPAGSKHGMIRSQDGAIAFLRGTSIGKTGDMMREVIAAASPGDGPRPTTIVAGGDGWREVADGAFITPLWQHGVSASMLLRLEAGARMPTHPLTLEEECMVLSGEAFFGDILLRSGEYQRTPVDAQHGDAFSDVGALLYVHGDAAYTQLAMSRP